MEDNQVPDQFRAVKDDDEEFLWVGPPVFFPFLMTGLLFLSLGVLWTVGIHFRLLDATPAHSQALIIARHALTYAGIIAGILNFVRLALVYPNTWYAVTNKRVLMRSGFWGIDFKSIDYDKISDVEVTVNPLESMFGVGTVRFFSGRMEKQKKITDNFMCVSEPYEVFKKVKTVTVDVKTDWNYPNQLRPDSNPGYTTPYKPKDQ